MRKINATKLFKWSLALLILVLSVYVYSSFFGTPWGNLQQEAKMQSYLAKKYHTDFVIKKTSFNHLSETYQSYAYPKQYSDLLFIVQQDPDARAGYSDTYPKVIWGCDLSNEIKMKIKKLFPRLDESTFKVRQIVERGEASGPHTPTYDDIHASMLACSITINIQTNGMGINQKNELEKMKILSHYLKANHFPVLIEIHYFDRQIYHNEKVFFITEEGNIVY